MVTSLSQTPSTRVRCASPDGEDVVFTFSMEMFEDAVRSEFCRPPDQTLLALARDGRIGRLLVADPWRSFAATAARRRSPRLTGRVTIGGRATLRVRAHRLRRAVRPWWSLYREAYERIEDLGAAIFVVTEELAARVPPRAAVVPNGVIADVWRPRHPAAPQIEELPRPRAIYTGMIDDRLEAAWSSSSRAQSPL